RLLGDAAGQRTRSRCAWPTEQHPEVSERHARKRGQLLVFQRETEMISVKGRRSRDIRHLIANTVQTEDASCLTHHTLLRFRRDTTRARRYRAREGEQGLQWPRPA